MIGRGKEHFRVNTGIWEHDEAHPTRQHAIGFNKNISLTHNYRVLYQVSRINGTETWESAVQRDELRS